MQAANDILFCRTRDDETRAKVRSQGTRCIFVAVCFSDDGKTTTWIAVVMVSTRD